MNVRWEVSHDSVYMYDQMISISITSILRYICHQDFKDNYITFIMNIIKKE